MSWEMLGDDRAFLRKGRELVLNPRGALRVVDLFAGCGGLTLGVEEAARNQQLAIDSRLVAESDPLIARAFSANFNVPAERMSSDVLACFDRRPGAATSKVERATSALVGKNVDLLIGGPPCQGHSALNNHTRGDDPKNLLYLAMARAAEVLSPRQIIIENVPGVSRDSNRVLERALAVLERLKYRTSVGVVSVVEIGVPQLRKRHVLLASLEGNPDVRAAVASANVTARDLRWAIHDLRGQRVDAMDDPGVMTPANERRARYLLANDLYDLPNKLRPPCQRSAHKYKSMYGRLRWDEPAQTITTGFSSPGQGRYLHPDELRTLTPREAARLQFFPDWFDFSALNQRRVLARAIGNAVPPKLSFVLAQHLMALSKSQCVRSRPRRSSDPPEFYLVG